MLDYRPNTMARALATGRSRTLGVVSFDTTLYGPASTLFGIHRAAHEEGYFISTVSIRTLDRESFLDAVERLRVQGVEGILVIAPQTDAAHSVLQLPDDLAVVAVEAGPERGIPVVAVDQVAGAVEATRAPARARPRDGLAHRRPGELARGAAADRRLAAGAAGGRDRAAARPDRRLEPALRATRSASASHATPTSPPSSSRTTRWRSASCGRCTRRPRRSRRGRASSASTTSPRPRTSPRP